MTALAHRRGTPCSTRRHGRLVVCLPFGLGCTPQAQPVWAADPVGWDHRSQIRDGPLANRALGKSASPVERRMLFAEESDRFSPALSGELLRKLF